MAYKLTVQLPDVRCCSTPHRWRLLPRRVQRELNHSFLEQIWLLPCYTTVGDKRMSGGAAAIVRTVLGWTRYQMMPDG